MGFLAALGHEIDVAGKARLTTKDGLTKAGRDRISQLMIGRYFSDAAQMDSIPLSVRAKVERLAAPLAQVEAKPGWNLTPDMQTAIGLVDDAKRAGAASIDAYIRQQGFFGKDQYSPNAITLAKAMKTAKSTELTAAARQYAQDAAYAAKGTQTLMGDAPTPAESFADSFGKLKSGAQSDAEKFGETKRRTPPAQDTVGSEKEEPSRWLFRDALRQPRFEHAADYNSLSAIAEDAEAIYHRPEGGTENGILMVNRPAAEVLRQTLGDSTAFQGRQIDADDVPQVLDQLENSHPGSPEARQAILSLKDQVRAAAVNDGAVEVVVAKEGFGGRRLEKVVATARHELAHRLQDELGGAKGVDGAINWDRFAEHPLVADAAERVAEMQRKGGQQVTAEDTRHEVPAYIAGGEWDRIGLTLDQAVDVYDHYLKLIEEKHGTDGVDRALVRVHADIRSTIRDTGRSARQEQSATISPGSGGANPRATGEAGRGEAASAGGSHSSLSGGKSSAGGSVPTQSGARTFDPRLEISHLEFFPKQKGKPK